MLKKSILLIVGSTLFIIGIILFPLPVPLGLPTMILGLAIMFKASNRVKRKVIRLLDKNHHTRHLWKKLTIYRRQKKGKLSI